MTLELTVSKDLVEEAVLHAKNRIQYEFDRFHLKTEQRLSMITIGTVGQLIFKKYLESKSIDFKFQLQYGKYDDYDFEISKKIIEVKTSGYKLPNEWKKLNGIYNASQMENALLKNYYASVQIFINGYDKVNKLFNANNCNQGVICGWLSINEINKYPTKYLPFGKAHLFPVDNMNSIESLFS